MTLELYSELLRIDPRARLDAWQDNIFTWEPTQIDLHVSKGGFHCDVGRSSHFSTKEETIQTHIAKVPLPHCTTRILL